MNKEIKNKKRIKLKNKKLLKKYPWLTPYNVWTGKINKDYDYEYTWYDTIPDGWRKCFGMMMIEEIDSALNGTSIFIEQIKEKYGELRFYCSANKEVQEIIHKYSFISRNVCINCGRPDSGIIDFGWITPICKKCFNKTSYAKNNSYEDSIFIIKERGIKMKFNKTETFGWEAAIRGMRNPLESWTKSDTIWDYDYPMIGENDLNLMQKLIKGGSEHRKFLRYIHVQVDITAPLYW